MIGQKNYNSNQVKPSIKIDDYIKNNEQTERSIALEHIKNDYNLLFWCINSSFSR